MRRRTFLGLMAALAAAPAAAPLARPTHAAADRLTWWDPAPPSGVPGAYVALEWRYLAGRIITTTEDFGFVVSLADYNPLVLPPPLTSPINWDYQELLVMRQDFTGARSHTTRTYRAGGGISGGGIAYDPATATFTFSDPANPGVSASWRLDVAAQTYTLSVTTPELTLSDLLLTPVGELIAEGGTGTVSSGEIVVNAIPVAVTSDYYADWVAVSSGGQPLGHARLDMQTLRPAFGSGGATAFSHHWFCLACTLADDTPAWVTAWEIVSGESSVWGVTTATGSGGSWRVVSTTDAAFAGVEPLAVRILDWQGVPGTDPARRTGSRWGLYHGLVAPGDALDLQLSVPAGQFVRGARISIETGIAMQESAGIVASGRVGGKTIKAVQFAMAESTYSELAPSGLPPRAFLPAVLR